MYPWFFLCMIVRTYVQLYVRTCLYVCMHVRSLVST